jgi:hypothetical protein
MSCGSGGLIADALAWVVDNGLASEEDYPYVGTGCGIIRVHSLISRIA